MYLSTQVLSDLVLEGLLLLCGEKLQKNISMLTIFLDDLNVHNIATCTHMVQGI